MNWNPDDFSDENEPKEIEDRLAEPHHSGEASGDYEVGYGKPPKHTRFKRGSSGNPEGGRKKPLSVGQQLKQILNQRITVTEAGKVKKLPKQVVMLTTLVNKGLKGDMAAIRVLLDLQRSHQDTQGPTIEPLLLEEDSVKLIEQYLQQQAIGDEIPVAGEDSAASGDEVPDQSQPSNKDSSEDSR